MEISGRNIECTGDKKTRVSFGGVEVSAADVSCATSGNILNPNPPSALKVHVHALVDGEYDVALTSDRTGDTANSSSLAAPMQGLLIQDHVRVIAFSPSEVRQSGAFTLTIAGSSFDEHARVFLDSHELTGAVRQSDHSLQVNVPASWFASLPKSGNAEYALVVKNPDGAKAFSDNTLLVHTGVDVLDFSPHAVYGPGDFTLTVAADGAVAGTVLRLNGHNLPATVNADGSVTATVHENGGFVLGTPLAFLTTSANAAAAAGSLATFTVASNMALEKGMSLSISDANPETVRIENVGNRTSIRSEIKVGATLRSLDVAPLPETIGQGATITIGDGTDQETVTTAATVPAGATSIALQTPFVAGHNHSVGSTVQPTPQDTTHFRAYVRNSHAAGGLAMQAGFASGDYEVGLVNPDGQGGVSATPLHIQMVPRIVQITPTTIYGQPAFTLKAAGEAFDTNAVLAIDGNSLSTTMNPDGSLQASVAQGLAEGTHEVRVTNPDGTFGTYRSLLVDMATTLTGFTPSSAYSDQNVEVTISGNNIGGPSGYYIAYIGLTPIQDTTLNPDGSLTVVIPMGLAAGEWRLRVTNPAGGLATAARPFVIRAPPSQLLPSVAPNGDVLPDNTLRLETRRSAGSAPRWRDRSGTRSAP